MVPQPESLRSFLCFRLHPAPVLLYKEYRQKELTIQTPDIPRKQRKDDSGSESRRTSVSGGQKGKNMDSVQMLGTGAIPENAVLIDLREEDDYAAGHIPGARHISMESLREEIRRIARFNTPILLYCYTGKKSEQAAALLQSRGYVNARSIGGIEVYTGRLEPELTVRELRKKKGLSQAALARMIGVRQPTVAAYESGKAHPGPAICEAIRRMLSVTVSNPVREESAQGTGSPQTASESGRNERKARLKRSMSIRELRKACGLTQAEFAQSIGVCTGSVVAYESRKTKPGSRVIQKIREVYNVEISETVPEKRKSRRTDGKQKA